MSPQPRNRQDDPQDPNQKRKPLIPVAIDVDAATLTAILGVLLFIPLILAGFIQ